MYCDIGFERKDISSLLRHCAFVKKRRVHSGKRISRVAYIKRSIKGKREWLAGKHVQKYARRVVHLTLALRSVVSALNIDIIFGDVADERE
jgi:hypothetical protein